MFDLHRGPPFLAESHSSAYFISCNRGKQSICIDIKHPKGRDLVIKLAQQSDVLVENFLPGELDRLGLGYDQIKQAAPHLHYASLTSYGSVGPKANQPGYDVMISAEGGFISLTGSPAEPAKPGLAVTDMVTGLFLANAIMAALLRAKSIPGPIVGQRIETSLFACQIAMLSSIGQAALVSETYQAKRYGTAHPSIVPYQGFQCGDGRMIIAGALNDSQFLTLCKAMDRSDLANDARFATNADRVANRTVLLSELQSTFMTRSSVEWIPRLEAAPVPCSFINEVRDALNHEQSKALGLVQPISQPGETKPVSMLAPPVRMSDSQPSIRAGAPLLGQHTSQILREVLQMDEHEIAQLKSEKVVNSS